MLTAEQIRSPSAREQAGSLQARILKEYLHRVRAQAKGAYVRLEPGPGERFEIDGAFQSDGAI